MADVLDILRGSEIAQQDRRNFLAVQLLFWMMAAPDGHAKNFSISLEPEGRFRMTKFYDAMSAWPVIGRGARQFQWKNLKMAMALHLKNVHYVMDDITRRYWNVAAKRNALGVDFEPVIEDFIQRTPTVIQQVARLLPKGFPAQVSDRIFEGLEKQVKRLRSWA